MGPGRYTGELNLPERLMHRLLYWAATALLLGPGGILACRGGLLLPLPWYSLFLVMAAAIGLTLVADCLAAGNAETSVAVPKRLSRAIWASLALSALALPPEVRSGKF
jgi:hypothetical protein